VTVLRSSPFCRRQCRHGRSDPHPLVEAGVSDVTLSRSKAGQGFVGVIEKATSQWGLPNGYVLGEEAGGAFIGGLRYGEGMLYTKNAGDLKVFWQGPTVGYDFGGDGARTMMLIYNLPATPAIYQRFAHAARCRFLADFLPRCWVASSRARSV
jgi:hypothetical protein